MDEDLIDDATLSLDRKSRLPGTGFFYPDSLESDRDDERTAAAVEGAEVVVVTDADADGLACVALIREAYGEAVDPEPFERLREARADPTRDNDDLDPAALAADADNVAVSEGELQADSPVALVPAGPHSLGEQLRRTAKHAEPGIDLFVCDICPDRIESVEPALSDLAERAASIEWFDHHQWDESTAAAVGNRGVELVVGDSDAECSADVTLRSLDYEFPERFETLAAVTRDHDLWLKEDGRSEDLADYSFWSSPAEYAAVVGAYGVDLPEPIREYVDTRREEKEALIDKAVARAEHHEVDPWSVGVTYGRCSQNEVAERLREQGADAAVIVKPSGSASIRGSDGFERAHEVAGHVNGGGHPQAAGCKPDIYDDMLDVARHWTSEGEAAKRVILAAFERVADAEASEATPATVDD